MLDRCCQSRYLTGHAGALLGSALALVRCEQWANFIHLSSAHQESNAEEYIVLPGDFGQEEASGQAVRRWKCWGLSPGRVLVIPVRSQRL